MLTRAWGRLTASGFDFLTTASDGEFDASQKCMWCALLYFLAVAGPLAIFRLLL